MKRADFKQIIKLRSDWKIDRRKGDYRLPNGKMLSSYVRTLVEEQLKVDSLGIRQNGDLCYCEGGEWDRVAIDFTNYLLAPAFEENESCTYDQMERRIEVLVREIIR